MGIKLAQTAGFCMGVRRAVDIVLDITRNKGAEKIYTYGPLIHNPQTIELLEQRGIIPVETIDDIDGGTIVIRAHGISLEERQRIKEKGLTIIDATCPKVAKVQAIIRKHAAQGYDVVIVGDRDHPEVTGLLGYSSGRGTVITHPGDVEGLPPMKKVCVVAQTTQNSDEYGVMVEKIKKRFADTVAFDTICDSTEMRQEEIRNLASQMDAMVVVGGKNSANTKRLAEISEETGTPTFYVETADELDRDLINGYENIGVSAGASTPNWIIDGVITYIAQHQDEKGQKELTNIYKLWTWAVRSDVYSAVGAGCLSLVGTYLQNLSLNVLNILTASLYVFAMHTLNRLQDKNLGRIKGSFREKLYVRYKKAYFTVGILSLIMALVLSFMDGIVPFLILMFISGLGLLYNIKVFPPSWSVKRIGDIPGSKTIFIAAAWAIVTVVIPQAAVTVTVTPAMIVAMLFIFIIVFIKSALSDIIDIQSDRLVGKETIPVVLGERNTVNLLRGISLFMVLILAASFLLELTSSLSLILVIPIFYVWICIGLCDKRTQFSSIVLEGLLETGFIIAGICSYLWSFLTNYAA
jgi:(E)-4-hydroxy-3-methyl-but-2-enyl pyrophosphate reductase